MEIVVIALLILSFSVIWVGMITKRQQRSEEHLKRLQRTIEAIELKKKTIQDMFLGLA